MEPPGIKLSKYWVGTGDRFAHQAKPQLRACIQALESGIESFLCGINRTANTQ